MISRISIVVCTSVAVSGCQNGAFHSGGGNLSNVISLPVVESVAVKALGAGAFSVNPFVGSDIKVPGIYKILKGGRFEQICEFDTSLQLNIKSMRRETTEDSEIIEDSLLPVKIKVQYLANTYEIPYQKIKVSGYSVTRVYSGNSNNPSEYVMENLGDGCPTILARNLPYVVVTEIATANNVETVSGGGIASISFGLGPVVVNSEIQEAPEKRRRNKIFAMRGKVVELK